jgi:hypothetical protein
LTCFFVRRRFFAQCATFPLRGAAISTTTVVQPTERAVNPTASGNTSLHGLLAILKLALSWDLEPAERAR